MIEQTLQLCYTPHPQRPTTAWFVASPDPSDWLQAAAKCDPSTQLAMRLLMTPTTPFSQTTGGALIFAAVGQAADLRPVGQTPLCIAYGKIIDRLYVPIEATLVPDVANEELQAILSSELLYLWHPAAGLIGFEPNELLELADFVDASRSKTGNWDRAQAGVQLAPRLRSLQPTQSLTLETLFQQGQDDIGSQSQDFGSLPPTTERPQPGVGHASAKLALNLLRSGISGLKAIGNRLGAASGSSNQGQTGNSSAGAQSGRSWLERLQQWTAERMAGLDQNLRSEREKAIDKLMGLLDQDPDEGLKYALPLGGDAHRGIARPGSRLTANDTNFNPNRLGGGGGPADNWDLSWEIRQKLTAQYRELANRELRIGRYRRAAYIFGELLDDMNAAASALEQGSHWREAALLYRERLKQPQAAARCYEQGGLWTEACQLYEELEEFEKSGDIHAKLDQHEAAELLYRKEVVRRRGRGELMTAARLLEHKLGAVEEAIDELASAWPATSQAGPCMQEMFALLGRHARHDEAAQRLQALRDQTVPHPSRIKQIEILAETCVTYPDRKVQQQAADDTRVLAARLLTGKLVVESQRVIQAVKKLAPEDRLLGRDCQRFEDNRQLRQPLPMLKSVRSQRTAKLIHQFDLSQKGMHWKAAASSGSLLFIAGIFHGHLKLFRYGFDGNLTTHPYRRGQQSSSADPEVLLLTNNNQPDFVLVHPLAGPVIADLIEFPETQEIPYATKAGAIPGMSSNLIGAAHSGRGLIWLLELCNDLPTLIGVRTTGDLTVTQTMTESVAEIVQYAQENRFVPMCANGRMAYIGANERLLPFRNGAFQKGIELQQPISRLAATLTNTRSRVAVALERGGILFWDDAPDGDRGQFSPDFLRPLIVFNRGGMLISASGRQGQVYSTHDSKLQLQAELEFSSTVVAVTSDHRPNRFCVLLETGEIQQYEIDG